MSALNDALPSLPNPLGVHALVWAGNTDPESVRTAIDQTVAAGYDLLEFSIHDSVDMDRAGTKEMLDAAGLSVAASRGLAQDADVSSEDPAVVERGVRLLHDSLDLLADIGGTVLTGALYSAFGKADHAMTAKGRANVVAALRDFAPVAASRGVTLGLEICNRYETNVINTAHDALVLADDIGSDNVMIHLDTYHMNIEENDFASPVREVGERLGYVHIGENHRGYLGQGNIDFASFFDALAEIGYTGPITFESFSSAVLMPGLSNDLAIWRNLWSDGFDLAGHARAFMAEHIERAHARS